MYRSRAPKIATVAAATAMLLAGTQAPASAQGGWTATHDLHADPLDSIDEYDVAVSPAGTTTALWDAYDGEVTIKVASRTRGGAWSEPETLAEGEWSTLTAGSVVSAATGGTVVASWLDETSTNRFEVRAAVKRPGEEWAASDVVATAASVHSPKLVGDASGHVLLVWNQTDGVYASRLSGSTWSAPVAISTVRATQLDVAMDRTGAAYVAWLQKSSGYTRVRAARGSVNGLWGTVTAISPSDRSAADVAVAVDAQGSGMAVWSVPSGSIQIVQEAHRPSGGSWTTPVRVSDTSTSATVPDVALTPNGSAVAVWQARPSSGLRRVITARRPSGGSWGGRQTLSTAGVLPKIGMDATGDATATWADDSDFDWPGGLTAADRPVNGQWSAPVSTPWGSTTGRQRLAVGANGTVAAVVAGYSGEDEPGDVGVIVRD